MDWSIERRGDVIWVTMQSNRVNKMNPAFFDDLHRAFDRIDAEHADAPLVITGQGRVFSAGLDFEETFPLFAAGDSTAITAWFDRFRSCILRVLTCPRPTVAAVNGHAFAGGLILALACDVRVAAEGPYKLGLNEVPIGIPMPSVYCELMRYRLGSARAADAILTGRVFAQGESVEAGFYERLVAPDALEESALAAARVVPSDCFEAYAHSKRMLQHALVGYIEETSKRLDEDTLALLSSPRLAGARDRALASLKATGSASR